MKKITVFLLPFILFTLFCPVALFPQNRGNTSVSIFPFLEDGNRVSPLSSAVTEAFEIALLQTRAYKIVEKKQIDKVLAQQGFQSSGLTDDSQAIEVGRILNSQYVIVGSLSKLSQSKLYIVNVRLINITTGVVEKGDSMRAGSEAQIIENMRILALKIAGENANPAIDSSTVTKNSPKGLVFLNSSVGMLKYRILDAKGTEVFTGETPSSMELPFGYYIVKAKDPKKLYKDYESTFTVESEKKLTIALEPDENFYTLDIQGNGGTLYIDGKEEGVLPFRGKVALTKHQLKVIPFLPYFKTWEKEIEIPTKKTVLERVELERYMVKRLVKTNPDLELSLYLDNQLLGTTPDRFELPCGNFEFKLSGKDLYGKFFTHKQNVEITSKTNGQELLFDVTQHLSSAPTNQNPSSSPSLGYEATIQENNSGSSDISSDHPAPDEYASFLVGLYTKYFTDASSHILEPGGMFGLLYRTYSHYFEGNILFGYQTPELITGLPSAGKSFIGLEFAYKYRFDEFASVGLHWSPGVLLDTTTQDQYWLVNDLAASIGIEIGSLLSIYYRLGVRIQSDDFGTRSFALNEIGFHLDPLFLF